MPVIWFNQGYSSVRDALALIREGAGGDVRLIASHHDEHAGVFEAADLALIEPECDRQSAAYADWCLGVCADHAVDLFVPQSGRANLTAHVDAFATIGTRVAVPAPPATLRLIDDKAAFYPAALAAGLPMPVTREVTSADGFDAALGEFAALGLEPCVKPPEGVFGAGFWRLDDERSLFATLMNLDSRCIAPAAIRIALAEAEAPRLLVLEYLAGDEWSVDCVAKDGVLLAGVSRRKLARAQRLEIEGPAFDIARAAVAAFRLSGLINIQVRAAGAGGDDCRLLEINSRMSGDCLYTRHAGVNLPWLHVAVELGLVEPQDIPHPVGGALVAGVAADRVIVSPAPVAAHA